jgi:hypothetical protein
MGTKTDEILTRHGIQMGAEITGDGWADILDRLFTDLRDLGLNVDDVAQVKEKFGGLDVHLHQYTPAIDTRIRQARIEASKTCEFCGLRSGSAVKKMVVKAWIHTLCPDCAVKE